MLLIQVKNGLMYKGGPSLSVNLQYLDIIYVCFNYSETEIETHTPKKKNQYSTVEKRMENTLKDSLLVIRHNKIIAGDDD